MTTLHRTTAPLACALLACMLLPLSACMKLDRTPVERRFYDLSPQRTGEVRQGMTDHALKVRRFMISPRYEGRELVYKTGDTRFEADYYDLFFVSPAAMLTQDLRAWLKASGLFPDVIDPASMAHSPLTLEGMVNALYGDYTGGGPQAVVEMQFFLIDDTEGDNAIAFSKTYERRVAIPGKDEDALVAGMEQGVAEVFAALEADLAGALAPRAGP